MDTETKTCQLCQAECGAGYVSIGIPRPDGKTLICVPCSDREKRERRASLRVLARARIPLVVGCQTLVGSIRMPDEPEGGPQFSGNCFVFAGSGLYAINLHAENAKRLLELYPELEQGVEVEILENKSARVVDPRIGPEWLQHECLSCGSA